MLKNDTSLPRFKLSPLGMIPIDWQLLKIQKLIDEGYLIDHLDGNHGALYPGAEEFSENGIPYISANNFSNGVVDFYNCKRLPEKRAQKFKKGIAIDNDVLFAHNATVGPVALLKTDLEYVILGTTATYFRCNKDKLINTYLLYALQSSLFVKQYSKIMFQSTRNQVPITTQRKLSLTIPKLPEQKAIAHILGLMDTAINKNNSLIAKKELQKKWLMQNLLTGKKRLNKFEKEKWEDTSLGDLFERVTRKNTEQNTNVVTISAQRGFVKQTDFFNKSIASEIVENYFLVEKGEFCYNKSYSNGYPWGATKRLKDFEKAVVTTLYICFGLKNSQKNSGDFFEHFFEANLLDKGLTKIAHEGGRAHGLLNVTPSDFFSLKITIPAHEEQAAIAQVLQAADKEIKLLKTKTEKLRDQKKGLMQQLLTGKKRLAII